jgi:hypothetical protein
MAIAIRDHVKLVEKPDGGLARLLALTVGNTYECLGFMGSNIVTTTDVPGETASYHIGRVTPVH